MKSRRVLCDTPSNMQNCHSQALDVVGFAPHFASGRRRASAWSSSRVQSRSCRCRSTAKATGPSGPWVWTWARPITLSPTVLTQVRRSHLQQRLRSPLLPELLRPFPATVHLLDQALDRRATDGQAQLTVTRVVHPAPVVFHIPQRIRRDLPRLVVRALPWRRPQLRAACP